MCRKHPTTQIKLQWNKYLSNTYYESNSEVAQLCPTLCDPMNCSPPGSSVLGILQGKYWSGLLCPPPGDLPNPVFETRSPRIAGRFFTVWATREAQAGPLTCLQTLRYHGCKSLQSPLSFPFGACISIPDTLPMSSWHNKLSSPSSHDTVYTSIRVFATLHYSK